MVARKLLGWGVAFGGLALAGCMGGEPEPAFKIVSRPAASPKGSLIPNVSVQKKLENPLAPPSGPAPKLVAQAPAPTKAAEPKADAKPGASSEKRLRDFRGERPSRGDLGPDSGAKRSENAEKPTTAPAVPGGTGAELSGESDLSDSAGASPRPEGMLAMNPGGGAAPSIKFKKPTLPSDIPSWFTENDADGDGMVGLHEWPKDRRAEFAKHDRNGDGIITIEEAMLGVPRAKASVASSGSASGGSSEAAAVAVAWPSDIDDSTRKWAEGTIKRYARKQEGKAVTMDEMPFYFKKDRFGEFDKNKDGSLDHVELAYFLKGTKDNSAETANATPAPAAPNADSGRGDRRTMTMTFGGGGGDQRGMGGDRRMGGGPGGGGRGGFGPGGGDPDAWTRRTFERIANGKEKIAKADFPSYMTTTMKFEDYDTNKDGFVDFEEYKAGLAKRFSRRN